MRHPKPMIAIIGLLLLSPLTAKSEYNSNDPNAMVFRYPPVDDYNLSVSGKTYFQILIDENLVGALSPFPNPHDGTWSIKVILIWTDPNKIEYSAWPGGKIPLPNSVTIKGKGLFGDGGSFSIQNSAFWIPGKWRVKGCIDDINIHICAERSFIAPSVKPLSAESPVQVTKNPAAVLPFANGAAQSGKGGFAPVSPGNRKPVTRQSSQAHSAGGVVTNPRLNPQPDVPSVHSAGRLTTPPVPTVPARNSTTKVINLPTVRSLTTPKPTDLNGRSN